MTSATAEETTEKKNVWTTWEELLLACAVKRHGLKNWDSVAMELRNRTTLPLLLTAQICKNKFIDLKRRFMTHNTTTSTTDDEENDDVEDFDDSIPWLEELRKLRVAELKEEVLRYDLSIQSLQFKVKILEEEREESMKANENDDEKPDLEKDFKVDRSVKDKNDDGSPVEKPPEDDVGISNSGEHSHRENRSFNESNSTENQETGEKVDEPGQTGIVKPDPDAKPVGEDSWNDSSDTASKPSQERKVGHESGELRDSVAESKEGTKESSDVQSSVSLTRKRRLREEVSGGSGNEPVVSPATTTTTTKRDSVKSEPLFRLLDIIRSHKHGPVFECRLESQKTEKYKYIVRRHVDLEIVQTRIDDGSYSSCTTKFYLDLLLLFNNAIVFFPKSSPESVAAFELRDLVLVALKKKTNNNNKMTIGRHSEHSPESAPILLQPKPDPDPQRSSDYKFSAPITICRKRSSFSAKASSDKQADDKPVITPKAPMKSSPTSPNEDEESSMKLKKKEMPVTGVRSMRRSSNSRTNSTTLHKDNTMNSSSNPGSSTNKGAAPKMEKNKSDITTTVKRRGAADFLKRIKKNSPGKGTPLETLKSSTEDGNGRRDQQKKRLDERKDVVARQKGGGKQAKESSPSKRGVGRPPKRGREAVPAKSGRDGGEKEVAAKRPKKRPRR